MTTRLTLSGVILGFSALFNYSDAQAAPRWTVALGPALANAEPGAYHGWSTGAVVRTDVQLWKSEKFSAGFGGHLGLLGKELGIDVVCVSISGCDSDDYGRHVDHFVGAGLAARYDFARGGSGIDLYVRGFAEPVWGRALDAGATRAGHSFVAPFGGAAVGIARGRFRVDLEAGVMGRVVKDFPRVWSLQFGFAP